MVNKLCYECIDQRFLHLNSIFTSRLCVRPLAQSIVQKKTKTIFDRNIHLEFWLILQLGKMELPEVEVRPVASG